jgi:hypothetical protein
VCAGAANTGIDDLLHIFFEVTETSRALGREYIQRAFSRLEGADKPKVARAQYDAIVEWGIPDPTRLNRLAGITLAAPRRPPAQRGRIYPDAADRFLFQYPRRLAELVTEFLSAANSATPSFAGSPGRGRRAPMKLVRTVGRRWPPLAAVGRRSERAPAPNLLPCEPLAGGTALSADAATPTLNESCVPDRSRCRGGT